MNGPTSMFFFPRIHCILFVSLLAKNQLRISISIASIFFLQSFFFSSLILCKRKNLASVKFFCFCLNKKDFFSVKNVCFVFFFLFFARYATVIFVSIEKLLCAKSIWINHVNNCASLNF